MRGVNYARRVKCQVGVWFRIVRNMVDVRQHSCEYLVGASACTLNTEAPGGQAARRAQNANLWDVTSAPTIVMTQRGARRAFQDTLAAAGVEVVQFDFLTPEAVAAYCQERGFLQARPLWAAHNCNSPTLVHCAYHLSQGYASMPAQQCCACAGMSCPGLYIGLAMLMVRTGVRRGPGRVLHACSHIRSRCAGAVGVRGDAGRARHRLGRHPQGAGLHRPKAGTRLLRVCLGSPVRYLFATWCP